jgi:cystathionine gamma-synthase
MDRHCANAHAVAEFLDDHPGVEQVYYPGLTTHEGYALAQQQMSAAGGMLSVRFASREQAVRFAESTQLFTLAPSLGGTESLLSHPASMTHGSVAGTLLEVPESIIRLSVGIESVDDLLRDLEQALGVAA